MFRTGPQVSAHDKEKQKQKKRLSFKDPEIEGPKKTGSLVGGPKQNQTTRNPAKEQPKRRNEITGNDFTLENQALKIAQSVGQAFSHPEGESLHQRPNYLQTLPNSRNKSNSYLEKEDLKELELDNTLHSRSSAFKTSSKNQDYLGALSPVLLDSTMRCPTIEAPNMKAKNGIPVSTGTESDKFPTGATHQIQLLKYQLDQQGQQTQTALHQIELLKGQLDAESSARYKAQSQNHQLMVQNKELLNHIERLFKQVEDLEKHVETLEQEKSPTKIPFLQEPQEQSRWSGTYGGRRLSSDQAMNEKVTNTNRNTIATTRRGSLTTPIKLVPQSKLAPMQSSTYRRSSLTSTTRPYSTAQSKPADTVSKPSDSSLRIGDLSPAAQKISNPFNSSWKSKMQEKNSSLVTDKIVVKPRTNSLTPSSSKLKLPETKQSLFGSCTSVSSPGIVSKKCSSSTSDLYKNENNVYPLSAKPLMIEEPSISSSNGSIGGGSTKASSKLPQFQKYSSWQRSKTMIHDSDKISAIGKEAYNFKNSPETSLLFDK